MKNKLLALALIGSLGLAAGAFGSVITVYNYDFEDGADQGGLTSVSTATLLTSGHEQGDFAGAEDFEFRKRRRCGCRCWIRWWAYTRPR